MIFSAVFTSLMYSVVKYLNHFSVYQIIFFRSLGTLIFSIPLVYFMKVSFVARNNLLLIVRAFVGLISMIFFFESIKFLDLGIAVSIRYSSPIFATLLAFFFLKEKFKISSWIILFSGLAGIFIIKDFVFDINLMGLFYALISSIFLGVVFVITAKIGNSENTFTIINYFMVISLIFTGFISYNDWINPSVIELLLLLFSGMLGFVGLLFLTKAFQNEKVNIISPIKYLEVVFSVLIGIFWFDETYTFWGLIGIFLILTGLLLRFFQDKIVQ